MRFYPGVAIPDPFGMGGEPNPELDDIVLTVHWHPRPLSDSAAFEKEHSDLGVSSSKFELSGWDVFYFYEAFPKSEIQTPPWHILGRLAELFDTEMVDASNATADQLIASIKTFPCFGYRKDSRLPNPRTNRVGIFEFAETALYRFRILQLAVIRDAQIPTRSKTRIQRLLDRWDLTDRQLTQLRNSAIKQLLGAGVNNEDFELLLDQAKFHSNQMLFEFQLQVTAALEWDEWVRTGSGPRARTNKETQGVDQVRINHSFKWFLDHTADLEKLLQRSFVDNESISIPISENTRQVSKTTDGTRNGKKLVSIAQIADAVELERTTVSEHKKKWCPPFKNSRGRGGGAEWLIDELWPYLMEQYGSDPWARSRLNEMKNNLPVTEINLS